MHVHSLALSTSKSQHNLLRGLRLLVEDGLGLSSEAALLSVVAPLALRVQGCLSGLVLRDFVHGVLSALLSLAVRALALRDIHHGSRRMAAGELGEGMGWRTTKSVKRAKEGGEGGG